MPASQSSALRWAILSGLLLASGACAQIIGLQPFEGDGGGGSSSSSGPSGSSSHTATAGSGGGGRGGAEQGGSGGGTTCAGTCAPSGLSGWFGPVGVVAGPTEATCPMGWASEDTLYGNPNVVTECGGCACGAPHDECSAQVLQCSGMCGGGGTCTAFIIPAKSCDIQAGIFAGSLLVESVTPGAGKCDPVPGSVPTPPTVTWNTFAVRCDPPSSGGSCPAGDACLPPASVDVCVWQKGDLSCPSQYPTKSSYFDGGSYSCPASCACGGVTGTICDPAASITFYGDSVCATHTFDVQPADGACTNLPAGNTTVRGASLVPTAPGSCSPNAPATFQGGQTFTVCCR